MSRLFRAASLFLFAAFLASCDSSEPGKISLDDYEGPEGEAVVRYVIKTLPPLQPEASKVYTVVKGVNLKSTGTDFTRRMEDLKLTFIHGDVLTMREPDKIIIDPRSGLSPVTIQIGELKRGGGDSFQAIAGWAYKTQYERHRYKLTKNASGGYDVEHVERLEGNYVNDPELKKP